jgi:hypothetical protein
LEVVKRRLHQPNQPPLFSPRLLTTLLLDKKTSQQKMRPTRAGTPISEATRINVEIPINVEIRIKGEIRTSGAILISANP